MYRRCQRYKQRNNSKTRRGNVSETLCRVDTSDRAGTNISRAQMIPQRLRAVCYLYGGGPYGMRLRQHS
jgi:hypothetical protein